MRNAFCFIIILLAVSCSSKENALTPKETRITGKILNPEIDLPKITLYVDRIGFQAEKISSSIDKNGNFAFVFNSYIPTDAWIMYNSNFTVLTHPGDSIYLVFDGSKKERLEILKTIKFGGDLVSQNEQAKAFQLLYYTERTIEHYLKIYDADKKCNENQFKTFMDSIHYEDARLYEKFVSNETPSIEVATWAKTIIDLDYYKNLLMYPSIHRTTNNLKSSDWKASDEYFEFLKSMPPMDSLCKSSSFSVMSYVNWYGGTLFNEILYFENKTYFDSKDSVKNYRAIMDSINFYGIIERTKDPLLRQLALTEMLSQNLNVFYTKYFENYKSEIDNYIKEPFLKEPLNDQYQKTLDRLNSPKIAFNSILIKPEKSTIKAILDTIITSNKGKVIYVDCWAPWCGPCMAEMPNSLDLMNEYKNRNVEFVYICLDSDEKNWRAAISKYSLQGKHVFLNKTQSEEFKDNFGIKGIPHYILIDKNGIISENNTDSPSRVSDKLDNLLN